MLRQERRKWTDCDYKVVGSDFKMDLIRLQKLKERYRSHAKLACEQCRLAWMWSLRKLTEKRQPNCANNGRNWSGDDLKRVIFSDKSKFDLTKWCSGSSPEEGRGYCEDCTTSIGKHSPYAMPWGCIRGDRVGKILMLDGHVNARKCKKNSSIWFGSHHWSIEWLWLCPCTMT